MLRSYLQKLVGINEVDCLLQRKDLRGNKTERLVRGGGAGVGKMFCLAYIHVDIFTLAALADHHAGIYLRVRGDEKVSAFVAYHIAMTEMRQGVDKRNVDDLRARFYNYLKYCMEHGIMPNNMNCYYAIGVTKQEMSQWRLGQRATPEHQQLAEEITSLFASIHEQAGAEQIVNPILSIYWSKAHDGLSDQPKNEEIVEDPLGQKRSAEEIASKYSDLPD